MVLVQAGAVMRGWSVSGVQTFAIPSLLFPLLLLNSTVPLPSRFWLPVNCMYPALPTLPSVAVPLSVRLLLTLTHRQSTRLNSSHSPISYPSFYFQQPIPTSFAPLLKLTVPPRIVPPVN